MKLSTVHYQYDINNYNQLLPINSKENNDFYCSGKGAAVGILKIGPKRLFVYDSLGRQHEMEPVCVLDFYVHESRQRMGCGKKLFEYFLKVNYPICMLCLFFFLS